MGDRVSAFLSCEDGGWLGAVGQGALGVEIREGDADAETLCAALMRGPTDDGEHVWLEVLAERMLLRTLEGGCSVSIGVRSRWVDGSREVRAHQRRKVVDKDAAEEFGLAIAREMVEKGAEEILKEITLNRKVIAEGGGA